MPKIRPGSRVHLVADDGSDRAAMVTGVPHPDVHPLSLDLVAFDRKGLEFVTLAEYADSEEKRPGTWHQHEDQD